MRRYLMLSVIPAFSLHPKLLSFIKSSTFSTCPVFGVHYNKYTFNPGKPGLWGIWLFNEASLFFASSTSMIPGSASFQRVRNFF
jgi:hypothetical protein